MKSPTQPERPEPIPAANCTHIKVDGVRCGSPALRGEVFCYFHQRLILGATTPTPPKSRVHPIAILESEEGIQVSTLEVINALLRNTIEPRRGFRKRGSGSCGGGEFLPMEGLFGE